MIGNWNWEDWKLFLTGGGDKIGYPLFGGDQISKRLDRDTSEAFQAKKSGQATGSQRYAQIAPSPQDEQKMLALPFDINSPKMQNAAGLIFFMADMDSPDDPCHPVGP